MIIKKIILKNFRNIGFMEIEPCEKINIICGKNAQGKTNIVEAIWLFTGAKSFRSAKDIEMKKFCCEKSKAEIEFSAYGINKKAKIEIREKKTAELDEKKLALSSMLAGNFYAVVFSPEDISLVKDSPSYRRKFLDTAIGQLYPKYIDYLKKYIRAVRQRNNILKDSIKDSTLNFLIEDFEKSIAEYGEKIIKYRINFIKKLSEYAPHIYSGISGQKEKFEIFYLPSFKEENLAEALRKNRREDSFRGTTSVGPHRDDIVFKIDKNDARNFASQGQQRSVSLCLKLAEAEIINEITGEKPVILLDDVMSELDKGRQEYILNHIKEKQVFLTCCEKSHFEKLKEGKIFNIKDGEII